MPKKWKNLLVRSIAIAVMTVFGGIAPLSTVNATPIENTTTLSSQWSLTQHPDYYNVEGKSNIKKEEFPQLYKTTEKVYTNSGRSTKHVTVSNIHYDILDGYGRSGSAYGIITKDMIDMSAGFRAKWERNPEPSGWYSYYNRKTNELASEKDYKHSYRNFKRVSNNTKASIALSNGRIRNGYLFDRSHLIADSLGGRPFRRNLVTGTRTQNVGNNDHKGGMQYIENKVLDYINKNPNVHVYYKAVPEYQGTELLPRSVLVSALSSDGQIDETVRVFNTANGFTINYQYGGISENNPAAEANEDIADNESVDEPVVEDEETAEATEESNDDDKQTIVYVTGNGQSKAYWYKKENMSERVNLDKVVEMTEQEALDRGKHHSSTEKD
ncbi:DNA/RNA non-specific endonuclease [Streptococcus phocae subsp. phocae]